MEIIRPISDLRNNFGEISKQVNENNETVFLTKNGYGNMVVMSMEQYQKLNFENEITAKLQEAELVSKHDTNRYSHIDVFSKLRGIINE